MPTDVEMLKKLIRTLLKEHPGTTGSHEQIVNTSVHNRAIEKAMELMEAVENGDITASEIQEMTKEE